MARVQPNPTNFLDIEALGNEGSGYFEDYYPESAAGTLEPSNPYYGRNVIWDGIKGRMIQVDPEYLTSVYDNIFDANKLAAIRDGIRDAGDRVVFTAPYGMVIVVDLQTVKESIKYANDEGLDRPLTTGDEDLDRWLVDPDDWLDDQGYDADELRSYCKDPVGFFADWDEELEGMAPEEKLEELITGIKLCDSMHEQLMSADSHQEGDLGKLTYTIGDGNHRAYGALLAGEPYIWMILEDNQFQALYDPEYVDTPDNRIIRAALK